MRVVALVMLAIAVLGCEKHAPTSARSGPVSIQRLPLGTVEGLEGDVMCVYYKDMDSGDFYRVSLDGTVRERVLKGGSADTVRLQVDQLMDKSAWRLNVGSVPAGGGYTVLDKCAPLKRRMPYTESTTSEPALYAFSDAPCDWTITFHRQRSEIEPGHHHYRWDKVEYSRPGESHTYDFVHEYPGTARVWLVNDAIAVLFDEPNVIVWNLESNERTCIAHGLAAELWPRNLHESERRLPYAVGRGKTWNVADPDDVDPADH